MPYEIDGCKYKTKALRDTHILWNEYKKKKLIKSFELPQVKDKVKKSRYFSYKPYVDDIKFDSLMEASYYIYLKEKLKKKEILGFERQVTYELQPGFRKNGKKILPINYIADFVITNLDKSIRIIDIKGKVTVDFNLKKKLFEYKYEELKLECLQFHDGQWMSLDEIKKLKRKTKKKK